MDAVNDKQVAKVVTASSTVEALGGAAGVVLAVIGLAKIEPGYMLPVAVIVIGATLVCQAALIASEFSEIVAAEGAGGRPRVGLEGEMGAEAIAGTAAIVLGVLSILKIYPLVLSSVAAIVLGAGLLLGSGVASRLNSLELSLSTNRTARLARLASAAASGSIAAQAMVGLGAVILGILGLVGFDTEVLLLVAMLILGASALLSGTAIGGKLAGTASGR